MLKKIKTKIALNLSNIYSKGRENERERKRRSSMKIGLKDDKM